MNTPAREEASWREISFVALGLAALTAVVLLLADGAILFTRPLWVDEWLTVFVAKRASPVQVISDLAHGADGGATLFHLTAWGLRTIAGSLSPTLLHAMSLLSVLSALCVVYVVLRRRFNPDASIAGVLAVGSNRVVIEHSFEGRFYGPWLLCCAFFAWSLSQNQASTTSRSRKALVAIAAILLCTVHWYGVITLGVMTAAVVASHGRRWRDGLRAVAPAAACVPVLLAITPIALGQKGAFTVANWIADFEVRQILGLSWFYWHAAVPVLAAVGVLVAVILRWQNRTRPAVAAVARSAATDPGIVALMSLALMPLALAVLSMLGQPSMIGRYAIPTALAWGPWVAFAMELLGRVPARVLRIVLAAFWFVGYTREANAKRFFAGAVARAEHALRQAEGMHLPIVFQSIHVMYPLLGATWGRGSQGVFLELQDSTMNVLFPAGTWLYNLNKGIRVERDNARAQAARYGFPRLVDRAVLDTTPRFLLLAPASRLPAGYPSVDVFGRAVFPRHRLQQLLPDLWLAERADASP